MRLGHMAGRLHDSLPYGAPPKRNTRLGCVGFENLGHGSTIQLLEMGHGTVVHKMGLGAQTMVSTAIRQVKEEPTWQSRMMMCSHMICGSYLVLGLSALYRVWLSG